MISCKEAMRQLWQYLEGEIGKADLAVIEEHLARCARCCEELEFAGELRRFLADAGHGRRQETVPDDVLTRLNRTLEHLR
jgi:anti-sigma factor (TIGR02949 family)